MASNDTGHNKYLIAKNYFKVFAKFCVDIKRVYILLI